MSTVAAGLPVPPEGPMLHVSGGPKFTPAVRRSTLDAYAKVLQMRFRQKLRQRVLDHRYVQAYPPSVMLQAALLMQRLHRGHLGRKRVQDMRDEMEVDEYNQRKRDSKYVFRAKHPPSYYVAAATMLQKAELQHLSTRASMRNSAASPMRTSTASQRGITFKLVHKNGSAVISDAWPTPPRAVA